MKRDLSGLFLALFFIAVIMVGTIAGIHEEKTSKENYNNGICSICGGQYRFESAVHIKSQGDRYFYTCQECGHTIQSTVLF